MAEGGAADDLSPGRPVALGERVTRIVAPNPGIMTGPGTNTYLVGRSEVVVIDPGPEDERHLDAVAECAAGRARWIAVTHTHPDHAPGAAALRARLPGPVALVGFAAGDGFEPDVNVGDGDWVGPPDSRLRALHTPGHASDHLCFLLPGERLLFSGDHVMDASTVVIAPPDGDMAAYLASLERLRRLDLRAIAPGHGRLITEPAARLDHYLSHRRRREEAVAGALAAAGEATVDSLLPAVYADVPAALHPVARLSLWAHLRKLAGDGRASCDDPADITTRWRAA